MPISPSAHPPRDSMEQKMDLQDEEVSCCAICFEEIDIHQQELPCSCNVAYCAQCWDRALAHSFNASLDGQARCPTCRGPICVDFDPERVCLLFSRAPTETSEDSTCRDSQDPRQRRESRKNEAVQKLRQQALPAQIRLLQKYGVRHPGLKEIAETPEVELRRMSVAELKSQISHLGGSSEDCLEKEDLVRCLADKKELLGRVLGEKFAASTDDLPSCVCGSKLLRVSGEERTMRCCDKMQMLSGVSRDSQNYRTVFERLTSMQSSICFCDLCGSSVPTANAVWTCENGDSTILHATSYDVCDECYMKYAALGESMPSADPSAVVDTEMTNSCHPVEQ